MNPAAGNSPSRQPKSRGVSDRGPTTQDASHLAYVQVAADLRGEILDGTWPMGAPLPTHADLTARFNVSRITVQRALKQLQDEGYVVSRQGKGTTVADWRSARRTGRRRESAPKTLKRHVARAFEAEHVTIDAYCLTAETLHNALADPVDRIIEGEITPASIRLRLLLPSLQAQLAVPRRIDGLDDDWPLRHLRRLMSGHAYQIRHRVMALAERLPGADVTVRMRTVAITPTKKTYLLNGREVLEGDYRITKRSMRLEETGETTEVYDVLGLGALLFRHVRDEGDEESEGSLKVEESKLWFDSYWDSIATDLDIDS
jgi:DNA-binding transcriptional regulator YhcF (GntR family)